MKKLFKMIGIIALTAIIVFALAGCREPNNSDTNPPGIFTVTFDSNGGSAVASITGLDSGDKITIPATPTKTTGTITSVSALPAPSTRGVGFAVKPDKNECPAFL